MTPTRSEQFWSNVQVLGPDDCWLWTGRLFEGYGSYRYAPGLSCFAHRYAYEQAVGPIPKGLVLDHVKARGCTSRACCNPAHLEPVTQAENLRRGRHHFREVTHCPHGHPYTPENTINDRGRRRCRTCDRAKSLRRYYRMKAQAKA